MPPQERILKENPNRFAVPGKRSGVEEQMFNMYKQHMACFWTVEEIDLSRDVQEWNSDKLTDNERYFIKMVLAFFAASDGIVNENLAMRFYNEVQIPEARLFYGYQIMAEGVHSEMYTQLLSAFVQDTDEYDQLFNAIETVECIKKKAEWARKWTTSESASFAERLVAFACVEGVMFSSSFCSVFWLKKRNLLKNGLGMSNEFIAREEGMHCDFACLVYNTLEHMRLTQERVQEIVCDAVEHEIEFACDALPVNLIGMNSTLMTEYIKTTADRLLVSLGYDAVYGEQNPFPWMELISLENKTNFFEQRVSEYAKPLSRSVEGVQTGGDRTFSLTEDF